MIQIQKHMLNQFVHRLNLVWLMLVTLYVVGSKEMVNKKETRCWNETVESSVKQKKTMERVAERRQQRKTFGGKKEKQNQLYM